MANESFDRTQRRNFLFKILLRLRKFKGIQFNIQIIKQHIFISNSKRSYSRISSNLTTVFS